MSPAAFWSARIAVALALCSGATLAWALFGTEEAEGRVWWRAYAAGLNKDLRFLRSSVPGSRLAAVQAAAAGLALLGGLIADFWPALLLVPLIAFVPKVHLGRRVAARTARFDEQIEAWLGAISNSLKASPSLGEAIESTTTLVPAPMSEEVDVLVKEYQLGTPLDRALDNMAGRIDSTTLAGTVLALKVARKSGGNLPEMLDSTAAALRELARLEGVVRTKTAEGRAQAFVIGAIPVPLVGLLHLIEPGHFEPLFAQLKGHVVLFAAAMLWLLAVFSAQKILAVDI